MHSAFIGGQVLGTRSPVTTLFVGNKNRACSLNGSISSGFYLLKGITIEKSYADALPLVTFLGVSYYDDKERVFNVADDTKEKEPQNSIDDSNCCFLCVRVVC
jgi:hypothetical protein